MGWSAPSVFGTAKLGGEAKKADNTNAVKPS